MNREKIKGGKANQMKATGIVRRIDDLGRVVIPKEIRRTMRIREGDPLLTTLTHIEKNLVQYIHYPPCRKTERLITKQTGSQQLPVF